MFGLFWVSERSLWEENRYLLLIFLNWTSRLKIMTFGFSKCINTFSKVVSLNQLINDTSPNFIVTGTSLMQLLLEQEGWGFPKSHFAVVSEFFEILFAYIIRDLRHFEKFKTSFAAWAKEICLSKKFGRNFVVFSWVTMQKRGVKDIQNLPVSRKSNIWSIACVLEFNS